MNLVVLVGPPGSGKSTLAKAKYPDYAYINQDSQGKSEHFILFNSALEARKDIVVDRMNFNKGQRLKFIQAAKEKGYTTKIIVLHESFGTCLSRCLIRPLHETIKSHDDTIKALTFFFKNYERPDKTEADEVEYVYPTGYKPDAVICDLDGTLCNIDHRLHWVKGEKKNWPMFFAGIKDDKPNRWCQHILTGVGDGYVGPGFSIVFCSGRGEEYRGPTETWLKYHVGHYNELLMRMAGDYRPDFIVKEIILDFEILTRYKINFVIDDRDSVCKMWRRRGFVCLQCAPGDF